MSGLRKFRALLRSPLINSSMHTSPDLLNRYWCERTKGKWLFNCHSWNRLFPRSGSLRTMSSAEKFTSFSSSSIASYISRSASFWSAPENNGTLWMRNGYIFIVFHAKRYSSECPTFHFWIFFSLTDKQCVFLFRKQRCSILMRQKILE